ncbi:hypothetical protein AC578_1643 [Pseudocercospora eumusae]|uniref:Protein kinase domain-containing protein n=1 Tax=Pseudocercospora eumusae TaxID=321146 RepID=A0A139HM66_9PEZI|nr:hypothetical protein AC578_1643 [Pseudocercospora eumusae]
MATAFKINGKTNPEIFTEFKKENRALQRLRRSHIWYKETIIPESSEGQVSIMASNTTHHKLVIKHVHARQISSRIYHPRDRDRDFKYPNEAKILLSKLKPHENIMRLFSCAEDPTAEGRYFLWTEHCSGGDLFDQWDWWYSSDGTGQRVPFSFVLHVTTQLFDALAYIHHGLRRLETNSYTQDAKHRQIVHGDVKPENMFLRWHPTRSIGGMPEVVLGDFGTAKVVGDNPNLGWGTHTLWAPEDRAVWESTHLGRKVCKHRNTPSDVYAAGMVIHDLLTDTEDQRWKSGTAPRQLRIRSEDERMEGVWHLLEGCLQLDPRGRATANFGTWGLLNEVLPGIRVARDEMAERWPLGAMVWRFPNPYEEGRAQESMSELSTVRDDPEYDFISEDRQIS